MGNLVKYLRYFKAMKGVAPYLCLFDKLIGRETIRMLTIDGTRIYVRTNTPDLKVAISCLHLKEYDGIRCMNPEVIIDAGANIGMSTLFFAQKFPQAQILAIEPEASNFDLLQRNTADYPNITTIKAALWGVGEQRPILDRHTGHWGYTVSETANRTEVTGQQIRCLTVADLMDQYQIKKIDLFKIDIEGAEKNVFENAGPWIERVDILAVELHDKICMGCDRAFYLSTQNFQIFEKHGDKVTAYRHMV